MSERARSEQQVQPLSGHWADVAAAQVVRERGPKDRYVCASGITPSGVVHIGNVREIISVELVCRALRDRGANPYFIYSWDDYDVFRKVPAGLPQPELLQQFLRQPLTRVPDTLGQSAHYAEANERKVEQALPLIGIRPNYLYQAQRYQRCEYQEKIKEVLQHRDQIRAILDQFRQQALEPHWWPVSIFCPLCWHDTTQVQGWDGNYLLDYYCDSCQQKGQLDFSQQAGAKLPWRIDWPMRWAWEQVDFEPAGKEHHSAGGSFSTARLISEEVFGYPAPVTFKYDFIRLKGMGGKMSSSLGNLVDLDQVLQVYQPELVRYLFVSTRPNSEFAISFDLDVLKIYEDYDRCVLSYYQDAAEGGSEQKQAKQHRVFELSQVEAPPARQPYLVPFRHLCNLLQIHDGELEATLASLPDLRPEQRPWVENRCACALFWLEHFAPEEFRFRLRRQDDEKLMLAAGERQRLLALADLVQQQLPQLAQKEFSIRLYDLLGSDGQPASDFFPLIYRCLLGREQGPRLVSFLYAIGAERAARLLRWALA